MGKKIAAIDNDTMNSLFGAEFARLAGKTAADWKDEKGAPKDPQAFEDHEQYIATLTEVLKEDNSQDHDPNDTKLD